METADHVIAQLGAQREIALVRTRIAEWLGHVDDELRETLEWTFKGTQKHFRPLTLFACHRAVHGPSLPPQTVELAFVVELVHNMSLIIDDILDESAERRGLATIHAKFGRLPAMMASGYLVADAFASVADDPLAIHALSELIRRLGSAECMQWRLRRQPLGLEDWRRIASEDTGSMFEICAVLGARSERLRQYGHFLGVLSAPAAMTWGTRRGLEALGGGGEEDIQTASSDPSGRVGDPRPRGSGRHSPSMTTTPTGSLQWQHRVEPSWTKPSASLIGSRSPPARRPNSSRRIRSRCWHSWIMCANSLSADDDPAPPTATVGLAWHPL